MGAHSLAAWREISRAVNTRQWASQRQVHQKQWQHYKYLLRTSLCNALFCSSVLFNILFVHFSSLPDSLSWILILACFSSYKCAFLTSLSAAHVQRLSDLRSQCQEESQWWEEPQWNIFNTRLIYVTEDTYENMLFDTLLKCALLALLCHQPGMRLQQCLLKCVWSEWCWSWWWMSTSDSECVSWVLNISCCWCAYHSVGIENTLKAVMIISSMLMYTHLSLDYLA